MRKPIVTALAVLLFGTIVLPGCFYAGPVWWDPDHDEGWHRHRERREWHERDGALTPQQDDRRQRDDTARRGHDDGSAG